MPPDNEVNPERRDELLGKAREIAEKAMGEKRELTEDEQSELGGYLTEVKDINASMIADAKSRLLMGQLDSLASARDQGLQHNGGPAPQNLGQHFVKHAHARLVEAKGQSGVVIGTPEFVPAKAAADSHTVAPWGTTGAGVPYLTDFDRTIVQAYRIRLVVADLLGAGTISGNAISYLVEGAMEGNFATVAEGAAKPQIHFATPTAVVDALKKIAGWIKLTDEFIEDADFLVSEINNRLLYQLGFFEEQQLLNGAGTGTTVLGLLNRSGIQTEAATGPTDNADSLFRAMTKIEVASGLTADGVIIHPTDYQTFRLQRDGNNQYYGGGFFEGQYGNGGMPMKPNLWGLSTVVTPAIAAGTALVGAFKMATTLYRKGGVRVESTNSHVDDFTNNLIVIRAEERVALAVRVPLGLCKLTLDWTP
jgi:HK97 family phage major capsid protein